MRDIAVGKDNCVYLIFGDEALESILFKNRDSFGIKRSRQFSRIAASGNIGDLGGGKGHDLVVGIVAKHNIKIVEVSTCCPKNEKFLHRIALV